MTDEQLEKQISEEFEKWARNYYSMDEVDSIDETIEACDVTRIDLEDAFKAAALPFMKKIESEEEAWLITVKDRDERIEELQKENEELREALDKCFGLLSDNHAWNEHEVVRNAYSEIYRVRTKFNLYKEGEK